MSKAPTLLILSLLICFPLAAIAHAQTTLQLGTPVEREIGPGSVHDFTVNVEEAHYVQLVVEQRGIDVVVKVFSPAGKGLGEFDTPNGAEGPEHVSFVAVAAGSYRITVGQLDANTSNTGRYQIKILEVRHATDQELKTSKNLEVTKARGLALLTDIEGIIPQLKSPQSRIRSQLQAAQLLWDVDEKRAAKLFADASADLKEFLSSLDDDEVDEHSPVMQLRYEVITAIASHDPDAALNLLHATSQISRSNTDDGEFFVQESAIELAIADQASRTNPARALQIARQTLKHGYSPNLFQTLVQLRQHKPEAGAELANEIAAKLLTEKFLKNAMAANLAITLLQAGRTSEIAEPTNGSAASLLSDEKFRELLRKIFDEASGYSGRPQVNDPTGDILAQLLSTLQGLSGQLETLVPGATATVAKKLGEFGNEGITNGAHFLGVNIEGADGEISPETIKKLPVELRQQMYVQLASIEANKGDLTRARQLINDHVSHPAVRREALRMIEQHEIARAMSTGKVEEALKNLSGFRNSRERAQQLFQIASQIGPGQNRATALSLLEQARSMLGPSSQAQDHDQMTALLEIARAFSRYDAKRAFEIIEPLIEQFNDICVAARTLNGFGLDVFDGEEITLDDGNPVAAIATQISTALGGLAVINFDRAKATTDRIRQPEIRLKVYLDIAQQTIHAAK